MDRNTYKSSKRRGLFTYLEDKLRAQYSSLPSLPGHYIPRLLFLFFMGIFYVGNTHYYEKMVRSIERLEQEVDTLRVDYTTLQADYAFDCKQSEVAEKVAKMGLCETPYPPLKIKSK
jgi:Bacteriodetes cell division protein (FtsL-like)